ncbi:MAG: ABC transporter ATP-binding protein [Desulfamplus sp.]|nr:ABC transporter ATP-binding protein [Desulfamplus sp.]
MNELVIKNICFKNRESLAEATDKGDSEYILKDINISINRGDSLSILGPSGCGKTTLLRIIAGFEKPYSGEIFFREKNMSNVPTHKRNFGMMFQDFALFPHKNVFQNISFGLEMKKLPKKEITLRVQEMLELVNLEQYGKRDIRELSGGERQRVALARTLAPSPDLIMLDEPLGALDRQLRERLLADLCFILNRTINNRTKSKIVKTEEIKSRISKKNEVNKAITTIWVTHDHNEAFAVSDIVCVMSNGKVEQIDSIENLRNSPVNRVVADFLGL